MAQLKLSVIGVPLDLGASNLGVNLGPAAFRHQGIVSKLTSAGFTLADTGDVAVHERSQLDPGNPKLKYLDEIIRVNSELAGRVETAVKQGSKVVVLGGDHSVNLGTLAGASAAVNGQIGQIYFDAHGDMNTDQTTLSGNIHGMDLAADMGFGPDTLTKLHTPERKLDPRNLLHIGGSDWDQAELDLIAREKLQVFTLFDVLTKGLGALIQLVDDLAERAPNIWISLDLDSIDQIYAPGAGMPNPKGLSYREIATIAEYIGAHCNVIGIDIVEYNPLQDDRGRTAELAIELTAKFLGHDYSWYTNYMASNRV
jgi:arginase